MRFVLAVAFLLIGMVGFQIGSRDVPKVAALPRVGQTTDQGKDQSAEIARLKKQRIALLHTRVAQFQEMVKAGLLDKTHVAKAEIDALRAQLEYTTEKAAQAKLLKQQLSHYDTLIKVAQAQANAPIAPPQPGRPNPGLSNIFAQSNLLSLQAERIKVEIRLRTL